MQKPQPRLRFRFPIRAVTQLIVLLGFTVFVVPGSSAQTMANYDTATRNLMLPSVQAVGNMYSNVVIRVDNVAILSMAGDPAMAAYPATYDVDTRYLMLPSVMAQGTMYYGLLARLDSFALISMDPPQPLMTPSDYMQPYNMQPYNYGYGY